MADKGNTGHELVMVLVELGQVDRELYRQLRAEAWAMAARNHQRKSPAQREAWLRRAS
jgi:hypothetical protein